MVRHRNVYIDLLRAAAILPVLAGHWTDAALTQPGTSLLDRAFFHLAEQGCNGVLLFFVISGFVIARAAMARESDLFQLSYRTFYPRRIARIAPLFLLSCAIGIGLLAYSPPHSALFRSVIRSAVAKFDVPFWTSIFTFTFNFWRTFNPGGIWSWGLHWDVLWSLAVEEQFYIAFPLLLLLTKSRSKLFLALWGLILASIVYRLTGRPGYSPFDSLVGFELIAVGILAAVFGPKIAAPFRVWVALFGGAMLFAGLALSENDFVYRYKQEFVAIGAGLLLCCAASTEQNPSHRILRIAVLGELSYGMYLLHPLVLLAVGETIRPLGYLGGYVALVGATVAVAALSYHYYEKACERFLKQSLSPRVAPGHGALASG